ncbi:MAG: TonB-dependent receptor family protein [Sphingobacteriaceae bacterium]|nr:TonB-dependent receptor family protein [Sphingobacteriaceae bacterium]
MKQILSFFLLYLISLTTLAQSNYEVSGSVRDSSGLSVIAATVKLRSAKDSLFTRTNADGAFSFKGVKSGQFTLSITSLGFQSALRKYMYNEGEGNLALGVINLKNSSKQLNEVVISGTPAVTVKEDTLEFRAADYKLKDDAQVEDLLKKLPGVEVDKDGNVKAQGKAVTRVRVNGKDFFGGDVKTATQQLPANLIDKIQLIDDYGDQANFTGVKEGDPEKILNIQIRPDKNNGYFTQGRIGQGNEGRYQGNISANMFNKTQQISVQGNLNNTNTSLFNFNGGGGGARIQLGGGGGGGGAVRMMVGGGGNNGGDGLTRVASLGVNYRDEWSKKLTSYGNYSYANRNNEVLRTTQQQNINASGFLLNNQNSTSNTSNINHRFNWNLEYKIDSVNYLKVTPYFNLGQSIGTSANTFAFLQDGTSLISNGNNSGISSSETPNFGADALFNHRFGKRGRTASVTLSLSKNNTTQENDAINQTSTIGIPIAVYQRQLVSNNNTNTTTRSGISYIEPLSRTESLEFNWNFSLADYQNGRTTLGTNTPGGLLATVASQSNDYTYSFMTNRLGMNYRVTQKKYNYSVGLGVQPSLLSGTSVSNQTSYRRTALNLIPVLRYSYNFSKTKEFNASYNGRNNEPSFNQLQPITDVSNPQFPVVGNPNLKAEFNHNINIRYNNFNFEKGDVWFTNFSVTLAENKIVSNSVFLPGNKIETRYLNTNGFYSVNGFYNWSKPFAERKYTLSINGFANYSNNINFVDDQKNIGKNLIFSQGTNFQLNPAKWIELNPGVNYTANKNTYSISSQQNTKVSTWNLTFNGKAYIRKTWILGADFTKALNKGYTSGFAVNPFIMNTYLEKQFLKNNAASLRFQIFDVYNENTSVSRSVSANSITDTRSNRLARYAMLTFSLKLQKFNGQQMPSTGMQMPGMGGGMRSIEIRRD